MASKGSIWFDAEDTQVHLSDWAVFGRRYEAPFKWYQQRLADVFYPSDSKRLHDANQWQRTKKPKQHFIKHCLGF